MKENSMNDILKTLQYIRALTEQGKREMAHMWNYIGTFGFYVFVGSFGEVIFNKWKIWWWALPVAFFFSTAPHLGWIKSFLTWSILTLVVFLLTKVLQEPMIFIILLFLLAFLGFSFLYGTVRKRKERRKRAFTVAPRLGIFWGILMAGTAFNFFSMARNPQTDLFVLSSHLWPFATGVGYLITGFFTTKELIYLGLLTIFGVPIVFTINPNWVMPYFGLIGLAIGILGIKLRFYEERIKDV
jgi:hypothetical protein